MRQRRSRDQRKHSIDVFDAVIERVIGNGIYIRGFDRLDEPTARRVRSSFHDDGASIRTFVPGPKSPGNEMDRDMVIPLGSASPIEVNRGRALRGSSRTFEGKSYLKGDSGAR